MAIAKDVRGLEVTIEVNGQKAKEYDDPYDAEREPPDLDLQVLGTGQVLTDQATMEMRDRPYVVKYIEAKAGMPFGIRVTREAHFMHRSHHIAYQISLDNRQYKLNHDTTTKSKKKNHQWASVSDYSGAGDAITGYVAEKWKFATLDLVDGDGVSLEDQANQVDKARNIGIIRVAFFHMKASDMEETRTIGPGFKHDDVAVCEKALKGKAVDCRIGATSTPMRAPSPRPIDVYKDPLRRPFAVFEFRYRSMDGLIKEAIVPRPSVADRVREMSEDRRSQLLQQYMENEERSVGVKNENGRVKSEELRGIKREASVMSDEDFSNRYKSRRLESGKFEVDLTDV